jgi:hypothetical protein
VHVWCVALTRPYNIAKTHSQHARAHDSGNKKKRTVTTNKRLPCAPSSTESAGVAARGGGGMRMARSMTDSGARADAHDLWNEMLRPDDDAHDGRILRPDDESRSFNPKA